MKLSILAVLFVAGLTVQISGCAGPGAGKASIVKPTPQSSNTWNTRSGLKIEELKVGDGAEAVEGSMVVVHYTGWLEDGTKFDSSLDRGEEFVFDLGAEQVIKGWDQGILGMRVGGKRKLTIPPKLGYGVKGAGDTIPSNATLIFEIELLEVE